MKKVLLAHPGTQHSFKVATALKEAGLLYKYATTVYDKEDSLLMKIVKKFLNKNNEERASRRKCVALNDADVIQFCTIRNLFSLALVRLDSSLFIYNKWKRYVYNEFQRNVANYVLAHREEIGAVIAYDLASSVLWDILSKKTPEIVKITDNAHSSRYYLHGVYSKYDSGPFEKTYINEGGGFLKNQAVADYYKEELLKADYHIVASSFSKRAAMYTGVAEDKIFLCPYGVKHLNIEPGKRDFDGILKILFVGAVNQRKGIYQVLEAAKQINSSDIEFNIVGRGMNICSELYKPYEKYVKFHGHVSYEKLIELYSTSHIFVLPTLGEGYGLVILEALSAGIPVIITDNCVGHDIVTDYYNGIVIEPGNAALLSEIILKWDKDRYLLKQMSINAEESVKDMTWDNYNKRLVKIVTNVMNK